MTDAELLLALGKAQVDAMFRRQDAHAVDVSKSRATIEIGLFTSLRAWAIE
jgi:hypothetical protein